MTTKLEAINTMLSCIKHAPLNSLEGTFNTFAVSAKNLLDDETVRVQLKSYDFNSEDNYPLLPDKDGYIKIPENIIKVEVPQVYLNRYVVRNQKIYDKVEHTFKIKHPLYVSVVFSLTFEELPEVVRRYVTMSAAVKFVQRELGSQTACVYTQQDLQQARADLMNHEIDLGNYTMIKEFYTREIKESL